MEKNTQSQKNEAIKSFLICINFTVVILIIFCLNKKGGYPYEDMDSRKKFDKTTILSKESFYSKPDEEGISDADYAHVQKVWKVFKIKNCGEYHDLYVQCDTLILADVFENFRDKCIEIYQLDAAHIVTAPELAWKACLKEARVNIELLIEIDML